MKYRIQFRRATWWTRERIITGLLRFYRERGATPISFNEWRRLTACDGKAMRRRYPSANAIASHWGNMRVAWEAVGVLTNRDHLPWSELDDWYLREAAGIIPRTQIARDLRRSPQAVHTRLSKDLGLNSYRLHGWALSRIEKAIGAKRGTLTIPMRKGSRAWIIDPADLVPLGIVNWQTAHPDLVVAARRGLVQRLVNVLVRTEGERD
ncbi:MAG: hypothetical protein V2A73_06805 [Pseudomonadota bacterium]